ncbi:hypothetical protein ILYODFUR_035526 [Ilyodon furcidens]|uniref:Uncharacterized protein n=1 Tax=Ilyodon furcidens TaxID=33524 RepID=A0ABV0VLB2_9TELE
MAHFSLCSVTSVRFSFGYLVFLDLCSAHSCIVPTPCHSQLVISFIQCTMPIRLPVSPLYILFCSVLFWLTLFVHAMPSLTMSAVHTRPAQMFSLSPHPRM